MKIAIFRSEGPHPTEVIYEQGSSNARFTSWARVSEWVEVHFPPCETSQLVQHIDRQIEELGTQFGNKLQELQKQRALLTATDERVSA